MDKTKKIFSHSIFSILIALFVCLLWGSLFPSIKMGYDAFKIDSSDVPTVILFAGIRFLVCSTVMIVCFSIIKGRDFIPKRSVLPKVLGVALFTIILHYTFAYLALTLGESSKSAIVKQVGYLFLSCFSFLFIRSDRFTVKKLISGLLGFIGIIVTNLDGSSFTLGAADGLLILASFASVIGTVLNKRATEQASPIIIVAYSQLAGGLFLTVVGLAFGARITHIDTRAILALGYICLASMISYLLWNVLLKYNSVSKLALIKFSEPVFAVILSGIMLGENVLRISYAIALIIVLSAIILNNVNAVKK